MTALQKVSRFIAESRLTEEEIYEILSDFVGKKAQSVYESGWLKRDSVQRRAKMARKNAEVINAGHDKDLSLYYSTDYTQPLSPYTLIARGNDIVDVRHLISGDIVTIRGQDFKVLDSDFDGEKVVLKLRGYEI